MPSAPPQPSDLELRLRQQLILAQVRIMELEDDRDESQAGVTQLESLLQAAQRLADQKLDEAAHLKRVHQDLQAEFEHMRHMQHVTNLALEETRARLDLAESSLKETRDLLSVSEQAVVDSEKARNSVQQELDASRSTLHACQTELETALGELGAARQRIGELDSERRAMKASRSWRWTAWLRSIERKWGGKTP